jgi:hypothetical protein
VFAWRLVFGGVAVCCPVVWVGWSPVVVVVVVVVTVVVVVVVAVVVRLFEPRIMRSIFRWVLRIRPASFFVSVQAQFPYSMVGVTVPLKSRRR